MQETSEILAAMFRWSVANNRIPTPCIADKDIIFQWFGNDEEWYYNHDTQEFVHEWFYREDGEITDSRGFSIGIEKPSDLVNELNGLL